MRIRRFARPAAVMVVFAVSAACGTGGSDDFQIGLKRVTLDLAFTEENTGTSEPAEALTPLPVPSQADLAVSAPPSAFERPSPPGPPPPEVTPPAPTDTCPGPAAGALPLEPVALVLDNPVTAGRYTTRDQGTYTVAGGAFPVHGTFPETSAFEIRDVTGEPGAYTYDVFRSGLDDGSTITTYRLTRNELQLVRLVTRNSAGESTFSPTPPVTMLRIENGVGDRWVSAGVDLATGTAMVVEGVIAGRERIALCDRVVEALRVESSEDIVSLLEGFSSQTKNRAGTCRLLPTQPGCEPQANVYHVATQHGALFVRQETHTVTRTGTLTVTIDKTSVTDFVEPVPAGEPAA